MRLSSVFLPALFALIFFPQDRATAAEFAPQFERKTLQISGRPPLREIRVWAVGASARTVPISNPARGGRWVRLDFCRKPDQYRLELSPIEVDTEDRVESPGPLGGCHDTF